MFVSKIKAFWNDEEGASLVEYVLLGALIGVAAIFGMTAVGDEANNTLNEVSADMGYVEPTAPL